MAKTYSAICKREYDATVTLKDITMKGSLHKVNRNVPQMLVRKVWST